MASGKTHDWVTIAFLPSIWLLCRWGFKWPFPESTLVTAGTFIGGFFLSPDLDIRSRPFYRWGWLRWIWWPYQWAIKHRSGLSHGIWLASWLRLIYLTSVLSLLYIGLSVWLQHQGFIGHHAPKAQVQHFLQAHLQDFWWFGLGLWLGAFLHISLDWLSSSFRPKRKRR